MLFVAESDDPVDDVNTIGASAVLLISEEPLG